MTPYAVTVLSFAALAAGAVVLELLGRRQGARVPTLGRLLGHLMRTRSGRVVVILSWWWVGWHFFAR